MWSRHVHDLLTHGNVVADVPIRHICIFSSETRRWRPATTRVRYSRSSMLEPECNTIRVNPSLWFHWYAFQWVNCIISLTVSDRYPDGNLIIWTPRFDSVCVKPCVQQVTSVSRIPEIQQWMLSSVTKPSHIIRPPCLSIPPHKPFSSSEARHF